MRVRPGLFAASLSLFALVALAQRFGGGIRHSEGPPPEFPEAAEFHFIRTEYTDLPQYRRGFGFASRGATGNGWWMVDWPDADEHFSMGVRRLTRVETGKPLHLSLTDPKLFDYPWIYATQTGYWDLSDAETTRLREYLNRGGFLMVDDFHNEREWAQFMAGIEQVLPGHGAIELEADDPIFHTVYNLSERYRVPGLNVVHGSQIERGGTYPHWRGVLDDRGRVVVGIWFNQDLGDAWEWADLPDYPEKYASMAIKLGVDYVIYAMTH